MESNATKTPKHVIILGAGASASSGYPVGNDLRLWMSSPRSLRDKISKVLDTTAGIDKAPILNQFDAWIKPLEDVLALFREGGFATVDEFCRLATGRLQNEVLHLKRVLRLALNLQNPEDHYEQSDYYGFVQRLFKPNLLDLRDDVVVLSFNYDVYLEFLLQRAVRVRQKVTKGTALTALDLFTSGFSSRNTQDIETTDGFCLLKLHGATAWPSLITTGSQRGTYCCYADLFEETDSNRIEHLTSDTIGRSNSPIVFPWEIIDEEGDVIAEDSFQNNDTELGSTGYTGPYYGPTNLFKLFKSIWTRAKAEVQAANKISIVGLSMHEYLNPALNFLFQGKTGNIDLIVADKILAKFKNGKETEAHMHPLTPVSRLDQLLRKCCPDLTWNNPETPEGYPELPAILSQRIRTPIRLHASFEEFILNELGANDEYQGLIQSYDGKTYKKG